MKSYFILPLLLCLACNSEVSYPDPWDDILSFDRADLQQMADDPKYEFQLIYTQIDRDSTGIRLTRHDYNLDTNLYFYPASTVKMPVAFLALQRLRELDLSQTADMLSDSSRLAQSPAAHDTTTLTGMPNVENYINKIFAVSDNDAYNRLYELLGQDYINQQLSNKGIFSNSRITTRVGVAGFDKEENRHTNPIQFYQGDSLLYQQPAKYAAKTDFAQIKDSHKGIAYVKDDSLYQQAFDMSDKNFINLVDLESCLMRIVIPEYFEPSARFDIKDSDYRYLMNSMAKLPKDHPNLDYDPETYYDSYVKFFMFGNSKAPIPDDIIIRNKVGFAYGYLTDVAYIQDTTNDIEFFLTATVHVNDNQTYNDGVYEYDSLGIPFLAQLGTNVYQYELSRKALQQ